MKKIRFLILVSGILFFASLVIVAWAWNLNDIAAGNYSDFKTDTPLQKVLQPQLLVAG